MSQSDMMYGSDSEPLPQTTPLSFVKPPSPLIWIGSCAVKEKVFEGEGGSSGAFDNGVEIKDIAKSKRRAVMDTAMNRGLPVQALASGVLIVTVSRGTLSGIGSSARICF